jgi:hypothetical protein
MPGLQTVGTETAPYLDPAYSLQSLQSAVQAVCSPGREPSKTPGLRPVPGGLQTVQSWREVSAKW